LSNTTTKQQQQQQQQQQQHAPQAVDDSKFSVKVALQCSTQGQADLTALIVDSPLRSQLP
jgi:hypothetical protein